MFLLLLLNTRKGHEAIRVSFKISKDASPVSLQRFSGATKVSIVSSMKQLKQELTHVFKHAMSLGYVRMWKSLRLIA